MAPEPSCGHDRATRAHSVAGKGAGHQHQDHRADQLCIERRTGGLGPGALEEPGSRRRAHNLELLEAILAIAFLTGGLTATLGSRAAQSILLAVSVVVLGVAAVGLMVLW